MIVAKNHTYYDDKATNHGNRTTFGPMIPGKCFIPMASRNKVQKCIKKCPIFTKIALVLARAPRVMATTKNHNNHNGKSRNHDTEKWSCLMCMYAYGCYKRYDPMSSRNTVEK